MNLLSPTHHTLLSTSHSRVHHLITFMRHFLKTPANDSWLWRFSHLHNTGVHLHRHGYSTHVLLFPAWLLANGVTGL